MIQPGPGSEAEDRISLPGWWRQSLGEKVEIGRLKTSFLMKGVFVIFLLAHQATSFFTDPADHKYGHDGLIRPGFQASELKVYGKFIKEGVI